MYRSVVLPRLKKTIIYYSIQVGRSVISDVGAVSLMKYGTMTKAIYAYEVIESNGEAALV